MTHCNEIPLSAAISYCLAIRKIISQSGSIDGVLEETKMYCENSSIKEFWEVVENDEILDGTERMGWAKIAWTYSFHLIKKSREENKKIDFKDAMMFALQRGGDTDTNCAIIGGLVGASIGFKELYETYPEQVKKFWTCDVEKSMQKREKIFTPRRIVDLVLDIVKICPKILKMRA